MAKKKAPVNVMAKEKAPVKKSKRKFVILAIAILAVILVILIIAGSLNIGMGNLFSSGCEAYCAGQPHVMCVGQWSISGVYPDCRCQYLCDEGAHVFGLDSPLFSPF